MKSWETYSTITETPGIGASRQQLSMLYTRYRFASEFCQGKDVLEVACGAALGLGYLAQVARRVAGGDIDDQNLLYAKKQYEGKTNIEIKKLDAHQLPYEAETFDVVILFETIYYLVQPEKFLEESRRILRPGGILIVSTVNCNWDDFNPSPFSTRYFSGSELLHILRKYRFHGELFGAFPINENSLKERLISLIKRGAVALHLIPKTMKGKQWLKRIFFGRLTPLPSEVQDGMGKYERPVPFSEKLHSSNFKNYKVLFAVGTL